MAELVTINHPFQTVDDFHQRAGKRLGTLIHRLASKYPQLSKRCGTRRVLLALSVAWALTGLAKDGNLSAFEHIDEALSPPTSFGCTTMPRGGCVMVEGQPFVIGEGEQVVLRFLWDGFTIFIDYEGTDNVGQPFFDFADTRQTQAYTAMGEEAEDSEASEVLGDSEAKHEEQSAAEAKHPKALLFEPSSRTEAPQQGNASLDSRKYLAEMVEGVASLGGEHEIRSLLASFSYIPRHDDYIDHLRGILLQRLAELLIRLPMVAENHFHFDHDVGQVITKGNGYFGCNDLPKAVGDEDGKGL